MSVLAEVVFRWQDGGLDITGAGVAFVVMLAVLWTVAR